MLLKITLLILKLSSDLSIGGGLSAPPQRSVYYFADHKEQGESSGKFIIRHVTMLEIVSTIFNKYNLLA
jgi:hypothetical protein